MKKFLLSLMVSAIYLSSFGQCSVREISLQERANASDLIIEGKVTGKSSFWNTAHNMIYTKNTVEIYKIFKGNVSADAIEILTMGGIVDYQKIVADPSLSLNVGDIGIFTCESVKRFKGLEANRSFLEQFEAYGSVQGFVKYDLNNHTASDVFRTYTNIQTEVYNVVSPAITRGGYETRKQFDFPNSSNFKNGPDQQQSVSISSFLPNTLTAGTGTILTINGSGFGATQGSGTVGFKNADDGGATYINALATQIVSWNNTQIRVQVPSGAGTGTIQVTQGTTATSSSTLTVSWAHLNVEFDPGTGTEAYQTDHVNDNGTGGYTWKMNTGFDGNAIARASFMRAFDTWRCQTGVNWTIGATTSINDAVSDGTNVICFDNTAPLPGGVLGVCYSYWSGCASGPNIVWYVNELDIIFDDGSNISPLTWQYGPSLPSGSQYDFESVAVHELGHGHQLGHVIASGQIMHYALSNGGSNRSLSTNDITGGNFVQGKNIVANICGPGPMTAYSCVSPPVAAFTGSPTTICAGSTVSFTDQSTNTPTSWAWTFTGGTPSSSSSQNPTITYNTAGTYAVSLTATNSAGSDNQTMNGYITVNANPSGTAVVTNVSCHSGNDGAINLTPSGGQSPYTFLWNPSGQTTEDRTTLTANTYSVTITDNNGCTKLNSYVVSQPTALSASTSMTGSTCPDNDGTATATPSGGTSPYTYAWSPGGQTTQIATGLSAATYTCTVTDNNGCSFQGSIAVTTAGCGTPPVAGFSGTPTTLCAGGSVVFSDLSTNVPTSWAWTFTGGTPSSSSSQNPTITYNTAGTYAVSLTATNADGSDNETVNGYITVNAHPGASGVVTNVSCNGGNNGAINLTPSGGQSPYTFLWNPSGQTTEDRTALVANTYSVTVTDNNGCTAQANYTVTQPTLLSSAMSRTNASCANNDGTATATPSGGTSPYTYAWSPSGQTTQIATGLSAATYTCIVTDNNSCTTSGSIAVSAGSCGPTQLTAGYCNINMANLNNYIYCVSVSGATNYRYRFVCTAQGFNQVFVRGAALNNFLLSNATGLQYNRTYSIEVAAFVSSAWTSYGPVCTIHTLAFPSTKLATGYCGMTETTLDQQVYCDPVGGATDYEYQIVHAASGFSTTFQRGNNSTDLRLIWVAGITYGKTYTVQVRGYVGGVWGTYATVCNLTTPAAIPAPNIQSVCNTTLAARSTQFYCTAVAGATNYEWNVVNTSLGYNSTMQVGNNSTAWRLSYHVGTLLNTAYVVKVRAYAGGSWGAYGPACTITTGPVQSAPDPINIFNKSANPENENVSDAPYEMSIFPNPAAEDVTVLIAGSTTNIIEVYNLVGDKVATAKIEDGMANLSVIELPQGIYIVKALTDKGLVTGRLVK